MGNDLLQDCNSQQLTNRFMLCGPRHNTVTTSYVRTVLGFEEEKAFLVLVVVILAVPIVLSIQYTEQCAALWNLQQNSLLHSFKGPNE